MRVFWIGIGLLTILITIVVPHVESERCKNRWAPLNLEGVWDYKTGCWVTIGGGLVREEYVNFSPNNPTRPPGKPLDPDAAYQNLARPDWVTLGPK